MGNGLGVQIAALRDAAAASASAAEQVAEVDLAGAISEAGTGVPGARAVQSFTTVGDNWRTDISSWVGWAEEYATALNSSADGYASDEAAAERDFDSR